MSELGIQSGLENLNLNQLELNGSEEPQEKSDRPTPTNPQVLFIHNVSSEASKAAVIKTIASLTGQQRYPCLFKENDCKVHRRGLHNYDSVEVVLELSRDYSKTLCREFALSWCSRGIDQVNGDCWLQFRRHELILDRKASHDLSADCISFGALKDFSTFVNHWSLEASRQRHQGISANFEHDLGMLTFTMIFSSSIYGYNKFKAEFSYDATLEPYLIVNSDDNQVTELYFQLQRPGFIYKLLPPKSNNSEFWQRCIDLADLGCSADIIGNSTVLRVQFRGGKEVEEVITRFESYGFTIYYATVSTCPPPSIPKIPQFSDDFDMAYSMEGLCRIKGFSVTDRLTLKFLSLLEEEYLNSPKLALMAINRLLSIRVHENYCDVEKSFREEIGSLKSINKVPSANDYILSDEPPKHYVKVKKIVVTPTRILFLQPQVTAMNRVLRKIGHEHLVRVAFREENFEKLVSPVPLAIEKIRVRILNILENGIFIGTRHFKFLGCSNSQLRQHGCWFYSFNGTDTVDSLRSWMGNFSHERCIASYVSRMGQCFSSSKDIINVPMLSETAVREIADIENFEYVFSDGIGKISTVLMDKVNKIIHKASICLPSALQIRYGGCKGVLALDPNLREPDMMLIRPSMKKFESSHDRLEVLAISKPGKLHLNRQVINLMSSQGIKDRSFLELQENMLLALSRMFIDEKSAFAILSSLNSNLGCKQLVKSGFILTANPFYRSLLVAVYQHRLQNLLRKSRILIPENSGRILMGVMDETGSLEYGQIFVQYSENLSEPGKKKIVHKGPIVVSKNPCVHPGDLRKFQAIDVLALHHMVDVIVFPQVGPRPHPNEISGSDLDGDMYFVTWLKDLIPDKENYPPMNYTGRPKKELDHKINSRDIIEFVADYIQHDHLGLFANAHLAQSQIEKEGIHSVKCLDLAQLHSDVVDYPKTGYECELTDVLRPDRYPDFMIKSDKPTFRSEKVLGKLYRQCKSLNRVTRFIHEIGAQFSENDFYLDELIILDEVKNDREILSEADEAKTRYHCKLSNIMSQYGVETEAEVVTGCILKLKEHQVTSPNIEEIDEKMSLKNLEKVHHVLPTSRIVKSADYPSLQLLIDNIKVNIWNSPAILYNTSDFLKVNENQFLKEMKISQKLLSGLNLENCVDSMHDYNEASHFSTEEQQLCGKLCCEFFKHYSHNTNSPSEINNPVPLGIQRKLCANLVRKQSLLTIFHEKMMEAYTFLTLFFGVEMFFGEVRDHSIFSDQNHIKKLVWHLNLEVWTQFMFAESLKEKRLSEKTGASITIREKQLGHSIGYVIEAWGKEEHLWKVEDEIKELERTSDNLVSMSPLTNITFIKESYKVCLEGTETEDDRFILENYLNQRVNSDHDDKRCTVPRLLFPNISSQYLYHQYASFIKKQLLQINEKYNNTYQGIARISARFGRLYFVDREPGKEMIVKDLEDANVKKGYNNNHHPFRGHYRGQRRGRGINHPVNSSSPSFSVQGGRRGHGRRRGFNSSPPSFSDTRGYGRGQGGQCGKGEIDNASSTTFQSHGRGQRGRGRGKYNNEQPSSKGQSFIRRSFMPLGTDTDSLKSFLKEQGFDQTNIVEEYICTVKPERRKQVTVILDSERKFRELRFPDYKWMTFDTKRLPCLDTSNLHAELDTRIVIQSRDIVPKEDLENIDIYKEIMSNNPPLLELNASGELIVSRKWIPVVKHVRHKKMKLYTLEEKVFLNNYFLSTLEVYLNQVTEYAHPKRGYFTKVTETNCEPFIMSTQFPDWDKLDEWDQYAEQFWKFSNSFADVMEIDPSSNDPNGHQVFNAEGSGLL